MTALSKRQQARNERTLQELVTSVPGNDRCADCQARNPGWASWSIGIFLCMRCAALHRKLGTHISKVKSLSMDSWTSDQVDAMKRNGNAAANKLHNPRNVKPPIPIDADEVDSAMERFIRQKYDSKILEDGKPKPPSREDPSYITKSARDSPPPLPPKPSRRFGFGLRSSSRSEKPTSAGSSSGAESSYSHQANKPSGTFGMGLNDESGSFESKLTTLRDMGFPDNKRNATVLKGFRGDLDKTVDALVRLGEGTSSNSRSRTPISRRTTPSNLSDATENPRPAATNNNPFDQLDAAPSRPTVGASVNRPELQNVATSGGNEAGASKTSYNPFDTVTSQPAATSQLEQSFQNLQVSQPLFPNTTGGYPSQQGQVPLARYQHSMTPPVTMATNSGYVASPSPIDGNYNPFFQRAPSTGSSVPSPQSQNIPANNPFLGQIPSQNPSFQPQMSNSQQQMNPPNAVNNPYFPQHANTMPSYPSTSPFSQPQPQTHPQQLPYQQFQQLPAGNPYATAATASANPPFQQPQINRLDKSSILSLYNFSQPPPTIPEQPQQQQPQQSQAEVTTQPLSQPSYPFQQQANPTVTPSATQLESTTQSRNPFGFASNGTNVASQLGSNGGKPPPLLNTNAPAPFSKSHMSQESIDIGRNQNGRHSPDIFASLSARHA